ncbi:MAG: phosphoadenosine phosphosulfate reductase family protein [Zestosphaera sp.]
MRRWGLRLKLYWCRNCNIPLREPTCGKCGGSGDELRVGEPGDMRPGFSGDLRMVAEGITNEFGDSTLVRLLGLDSGLFFLNKVPHVDDMREVIVGGVVVGRLHFDPGLMCWRWRLSKYSAGLAVEEGLVRSFVVEKPKPLEPLGEGGREGEQAVVTDGSGTPKALAIVKKGRFRVQTFFRGGPEEPVRVRAVMEDVIKGNDLWVRSRISKGVKSVAVMVAKTGLPVVVSYSGGKDSLVTLHLTLEAGVEPVMLFNDTGLELPETIHNVEEVSRAYGLRSLVADADGKFWDAANVFGPPGKDYRWCCKVIKLVPIARVYRTNFPGGVLSVVGQRAFESVDRSLSGNVWRNRWLPSVLSMTPIQEWDQIALWSYIHAKRLPVNPLYFEGFERLGCYLCPAANVAEYHELQRKYPDMWGRWDCFLRRWFSERAMPEEYVTKHLWRWHDPGAQGRKRVERWAGLSNRSWVSEYVLRSGFEATLTGGSQTAEAVSVKVTPSLPLEAYLSQWRVLGYRHEHAGEYVRIKSFAGVTEISVDGVLSASSSEAFEEVLTAIKVGVRWLKCVSCFSCVNWCPRGAVDVVDGRPEVDPLRCTGCRICVSVCPVAEVFVEKNIVTQLIGRSRGRGRKGTLTQALSLLLSRGSGGRWSGRRVQQEPEPSLNGLRDFLSRL